jgi:hypothetical protein
LTAITDHSTPPLAPGNMRAPSAVGNVYMPSCDTIGSEKRMRLQSLRLLT